MKVCEVVKVRLQKKGEKIEQGESKKTREEGTGERKRMERKMEGKKNR